VELKAFETISQEKLKGFSAVSLSPEVPFPNRDPDLCVAVVLANVRREGNPDKRMVGIKGVNFEVLVRWGGIKTQLFEAALERAKRLLFVRDLAV
jgi:hypothetical protein